MDTRIFPPHRRGPVRQAHPRSSRHRLVDSATLLVGLVLLGALTLGTVVGAPASGAATRPSGEDWRALSVAPAALPGSPSPARAAERAGSTTSAVAAPASVAAERAPSRGPRTPADGAAATASPTASVEPVADPAPSPIPSAIPERAAAEPSRSVPRPVAAFLGDSYTTGWAGAGMGRRGWPAIVSAAHGWRVVNRAVAGTGFVNAGWTGQPVRTRLAAVVSADPGIVFVAAGHNDGRYGRRATGDAAEAVLRRLRRALPDAVIVVIAPIWANGSPPASIRGIRSELRASADSIDAIFVDPIRDGWFAGTARRLILDDGIHPSNAGHRRIAARVLSALEGLR